MHSTCYSCLPIPLSAPSPTSSSHCQHGAHKSQIIHAATPIRPPTRTRLSRFGFCSRHCEWVWRRCVCGGCVCVCVWAASLFCQPAAGRCSCASALQGCMYGNVEMCGKWKMHLEIRTLNFTHCLRFIALVAFVSLVLFSSLLLLLLLPLLLPLLLLLPRYDTLRWVQTKQHSH